MPTRSSFGSSSLPVTESPTSFQPTLIHGPIPSVKIAGYIRDLRDRPLPQRREPVA